MVDFVVEAKELSRSVMVRDPNTTDCLACVNGDRTPILQIEQRYYTRSDWEAMKLAVDRAFDLFDQRFGKVAP